MPPEITGERIVHDGWCRMRTVEFSFPDGVRLTREVEDHGRAVCVLPYDPDRRVALLIRQFRAPLFYADGTADLIEAPAGLLDEPDPKEGARREAYEEAGVRLGPLESIASVWSMPGVSTERMDLFLAVYSQADRSGPGGGVPDEGEDIEVLEMPLATLARMSESGELTDVKTLLMVLALRLRRPELFEAGADATPT